jgi:protein-tyrosine phosphatase
MIDTHCHLLPALDDGPRNAAESVELARALADAGVEHVVCTPHVSRRYPTLAADAHERLEVLRPLLVDAEVELTLDLAGEIGPGLLVNLDDDELRARAILGRALLVELEPDTAAPFVELATARVQALELVTVFAHPERSRAVQRDAAVIAEARAAGALTQVVASSLAGSWGDSVRRAAWEMLHAGDADMLASDAHRVRDAFRFRDVADRVRERFGEEACARLVSITPAALVRTGSELPRMR